MNISDTTIITAGTWLAGVFSAAIVAQFKMVISLNKRIGRLESKIESQEEDLKEYRSCAVPECPFRFRNHLMNRPRTVTISAPTTPQTS